MCQRASEEGLIGFGRWYALTTQEQQFFELALARSTTSSLHRGRAVHHPRAERRETRLVYRLLCGAAEGDHLHDPRTGLIEWRGRAVAAYRGDRAIFRDITIRLRYQPATKLAAWPGRKGLN
jgi:hypothetical protein